MRRPRSQASPSASLVSIASACSFFATAAALAGPDSLEEEEILPGRVEEQRCLERRLRESAEVTARPHRADEDLGVEEMIGQANAVAEKSSPREGAGRVDGDHPDASVLCANVANEGADEA